MKEKKQERLWDLDKHEHEKHRVRLAQLKKNPKYRSFWNEYGGAKFLDSYFSINIDLPPEEKIKTPAFIAVEDFISELTAFNIDWPFQADDEQVKNFVDLIDPFSIEEIPNPLPRPVFREYPSVAGVWSDDEIQNESRFVLSNNVKLRPSERLLRIDLSRSRGELKDDFERFLDRIEYFRKTDDVPESWKLNYATWTPDKSRFNSKASWKALEVWDLWQEAGKTPAIQTFKYIAKKLKRPLSTVKDQWYTAFEKIYGKKYDASVKNATEERRQDADEMCARCGRINECYRMRDGRMEFTPCKAYLKVLGIERDDNHLAYIDEYAYNADDE